MIDIVKQLEAMESQIAYDAADIIRQLRQQLFDRAEEVETWKNRWQAERKDHEDTLRAWEEERSGL